MSKSFKKKLVAILIIMLTIIAVLIYIILETPKKITSSFPDTITIDSKYYLQKISLLDYVILGYQDGNYIIQDSSKENDFCEGVCSQDGTIVISPIYRDVCFIDEDTIKGWRTETDVYYFDSAGRMLDHGEYTLLKDTYESPITNSEDYTVEEFQSTVYTTDENGNPKKILGKYVVYGTSTKEIVFPTNVEFKDVTIANITGQVFVGDIYDEIYYYSNDDKMVLVKKDDVVYYCDIDGNPVFTIECKFVENDDGDPCFARKGYDELYPIYMFNRGYAITVSGELYGLINLEGDIIIDFNYDEIIQLPYNLYIAKNSDGVAICDISKNEGLVSPYFKDIQSFDDIIVLYDSTTDQSIVYSIEMNV